MTFKDIVAFAFFVAAILCGLFSVTGQLRRIADALEQTTADPTHAGD